MGCKQVAPAIISFFKPIPSVKTLKNGPPNSSLSQSFDVYCSYFYCGSQTHILYFPLHDVWNTSLQWSQTTGARIFSIPRFLESSLSSIPSGPCFNSILPKQLHFDRHWEVMGFPSDSHCKKKWGKAGKSAKKRKWAKSQSAKKSRKWREKNQIFSSDEKICDKDKKRKKGEQDLLGIFIQWGNYENSWRKWFTFFF